MKSGVNITLTVERLCEFAMAMSDKRRFLDDYEFELPKRKRPSTELTSKELKKALEIHALIYSSQKKLNENVEPNKTDAIPSPSSSNAPVDAVVPEVSPSTSDDDTTPTRNETLEIYEQTVRSLIHSLADNATSVCLTIDYHNASASMGQNYIAVTAHYVDRDLDMNHMLLELMPVIPLDITFLAIQIKRVAKRYNIEKKVTHIVAKYSPHINKVIKKLDFPNVKHFSWCFVESLNQIVANALAPIEYIFLNIKTITNFINKNSAAFDSFCNHQMSIGDDVQPKLLERSTRRCWLSKYIHLQRFVEVKESIIATLGAVDHTCPVLDEEQWMIAEQLCHIIKPFMDVISSISSDYIPTLPGSMVIVLTNGLKFICDEFLRNPDNELYNEVVMNVVRSMQAELADLFSVESHEFGWSLGVNTFLDPRFKIYGFQNDKAVSMIKNYLHKLIIGMIEKRSNDAREQYEEDIRAWEVFDKFIDTMKSSPAAKASLELNMYIDAELLPRKNPDGEWNDPARWWRDHRTIFPNLAEIYRSKCDIVGTTVQCERLLSYAGRLLKECTSKVTMEQLAFLNVNQNCECN